MRGADASAGTIKSGGATRRAAKMVVLDVDHPDIEEFVETKAREEDKIRALRDAGFDMDLGGKDITSVQYQNANNSVRVNDEFMRAVEEGTRVRPAGPRTTAGSSRPSTPASCSARSPRPRGSAPTRASSTTTRSTTGTPTPRPAGSPRPTRARSTCRLDNSSCNLASLNLLKFLERRRHVRRRRPSQKVVELVITAMDISICFADFPTEPIGETTRNYRQLGIGYANLGALLMATGHGYDSEGGRALAASITSLMTGTAYKRSAELAAVVGPYDGYARNADAHKRVMRKHAGRQRRRSAPLDAMDTDVHRVATKAWDDVVKLGEKNGYRNAQASVLAPTGTIGFMMDCDTTGIEPDFSLVKFKKLVGGGSMQIVNQTIPRALRKLGYTEETDRGDRRVHRRQGPRHRRPRPEARALRGLRLRHGRARDRADGPRADDGRGPAVPVRCHLQDGQPARDGHGRGDRGRLPAGLEARPQGARGLPRQLQGRPAAVRRWSTAKDAAADKAAAAAEVKVEKVVEYRPVRKRLPKRRPSQTTSFAVGGAEGYLTAGSYPDDGLGEVFLKFGKQGSTLAGVMDAFSIAISIGLQYGVPLETFVEKFTNMRFEPAGLTDDPDVRMAQSIMDYVFRRLALDYLDFETRSFMGIHTADERARQLETGSYASRSPTSPTRRSRTSSSRYSAVRSRRPSPSRPTPSRASRSRPPRSSPAPVPPPPVRSTGVHSSAELLEKFQGIAADAPICMTCGTKMRPAGSCYVCEGCGSTSGCS